MYEEVKMMQVTELEFIEELFMYSQQKNTMEHRHYFSWIDLPHQMRNEYWNLKNISNKVSQTSAQNAAMFNFFIQAM